VMMTAVRFYLEGGDRYACPGLPKDQVLARLPPHTKGCMLAGQTRGTGHMRCVRYDQENEVWFAMDSWEPNNNAPLLTDADWIQYT